MSPMLERKRKKGLQLGPEVLQEDSASADHRYCNRQLRCFPPQPLHEHSASTAAASGAAAAFVVVVIIVVHFEASRRGALPVE